MFKQAFVLFMSMSLYLCLLNKARSEPIDNAHQLLALVQASKKDVAEQCNVWLSGLKDFADKNKNRTQLLVIQKGLFDKHIVKKLFELDGDVAASVLLLDQGFDGRAHETLVAVREQYRLVLGDLRLISKVAEAEERTSGVLADSKMFYKMKMRIAKPPPNALKAYGVMGLAQRASDRGAFLKALSLWSKAEKMVHSAQLDYIASRAKQREQWQKNVKMANTKNTQMVAEFLRTHFVDIPSGRFQMGSEDAGIDERPIHTVSVPAFKMGKTEVTFELWQLCVDMGGCLFTPVNHGWGTGDQPVIGVSYRDIHLRFLPWLKKVTGKYYRLPSEAEWEYSASAGSAFSYSWGDKIHCDKARYNGGIGSACSTQHVERRGPVEVGRYKANAFGLYDMHGNVWEWVEDCWVNTFNEAPVDGSARGVQNCNVRVLRGGSWKDRGSALRTANRFYSHFKARKPSYGFRLALDIVYE